MASNSGTDVIRAEDESDDGVYIRPSKKKVINSILHIESIYN